MFTKEQKTDILKNVEKLLNNVYVRDIYWYFDDIPVICVNVDGDWKHDHLRCDYILKETGKFKLLKTEVLDDTGSDWYNAIRYYFVMS